MPMTADMLHTSKQLIANQFAAALATLNCCIQRCPEQAWDLPVGNLAFCQVVFHTLFFADVYLGKTKDSYLSQPFHRDHPEYFREYEEMQPRLQTLLYDRPTTCLYMEHCRQKAETTIAAETAESLTAPTGMWHDFSRAELYVYTARHIQHHAAQLSLRLRLDHDQDIPWFGSGWRDPG